jgi:hypothetical protein
MTTNSKNLPALLKQFENLSDKADGAFMRLRTDHNGMIEFGNGHNVGNLFKLVVKVPKMIKALQSSIALNKKLVDGLDKYAEYSAVDGRPLNEAAKLCELAAKHGVE